MAKKASLVVGKKVSDFSLPSSDGTEFNLSDYKGQNVVLYFYPKDSTPGCTLEGLDFTKLYKKFKSKNTVVFGVSKDSIKSHCNFRDKQKFSLSF